MSASTLLRLNGLLVLLFFLGSAAVWPELPERIATHFNFRGQPTTWVRTSWYAWFGLPLVSASTALFLWGAGRWAARNPTLWNIPEKQRFLRLSSAARAPTVASLERYLAWVGLGVTVIFMAVQVGIYRTTMGHTPGMPWVYDVIVLGGFVAIVLGALLLNRRIRRRILDAADEEALRC